MAVSDKQKEYRNKYDKENFQYITFKAKKGSKERIAEAATVIGQSTNGFIRSTLNKAVEEVTGSPMEYVPDEQATKDGEQPEH